MMAPTVCIRHTRLARCVEERHAPVKKIVLWLLVIFALYAILVSPDDAASLVGTITGHPRQRHQNIGRFFDTLLLSR